MLVSGIDLSAHEAVSDAAADTQCTYRHRSVGDAETHEHCLMDSFIHISFIFRGRKWCVYFFAIVVVRGR